MPLCPHPLELHLPHIVSDVGLSSAIIMISHFDRGCQIRNDNLKVIQINCVNKLVKCHVNQIKETIFVFQKEKVVEFD